MIKSNLNVIVACTFLNMSNALFVSPAIAMPDETNTGYISAYEELEKISTVTIKQDGTILEKFRTSGSIIVQANNVTIRDFFIENSSGLYGIQVNGNYENVIVEDGEITGCRSSGLRGPGIVARRLHIHRMLKDGGKPDGPFLIEDSYLHDIGDRAVNPDAHADALQIRTGNNIIIRGNNFDVPVGNPDYLNHRAMIIQTAEGPINNVIVEDNWINGGGYSADIRAKAGASFGIPTNVTLRNNLFGRDFEFKAWIIVGDSTNTAYNNRWMDTGLLIEDPVQDPDPNPDLIDTTAPVMSGISTSNISSDGAVITWLTDENATSVVEYGTTNSYGSTASTSGLTTSHNVVLTGLQDDTIYYYRVKSTDSSNNEAISGEFTFTTLIPDDIDPACTLISPLDGEILSTSVILTASASDNLGGSGVATVEFLLNGSVIGSGSQSDSTTYTLNWNTTIVQNGDYTLQAVVTDFEGNQGVSNQIFVTVDNSTVGVISDSNWWNQSIMTQAGTFEVSFDVVPFTNSIDGVIGIASTSADGYRDLAAIVRFFTNGKIDARNGSIYEADIDLAYQSGSRYEVRMRIDVPNKLYSIWITPQGQAEVLLANNYAFRTEQSDVTSLAWIASFNSVGNHELSNWKASLSPDELDTTPPDITIIQPTEGEAVNGVVVVMTDASDNNAVSQVSFEIDGIELEIDTTDPYTFSWNTIDETNGTHRITAIATDNAGNVGSSEISVTVENTLVSGGLPPSLFMDSEDLVRVQGIVTDSSSSFYPNYQLLISRADSALDSAPDPFSMADISQIQFGWCQPASFPDDSLKDLTKKLEVQSDRGRTLALAWLLTGNQSYADGAVEMLNAWASGSTLVNMYDFNINFNNATFDGSTSDGYCGVRPWNMALDAMWQTYGLINFADSYIILKSNGYPFSTVEENLIRGFLLELIEAVNASFHAWTRWADAHPNSSSFERYRSDNHLSWCLAGLMAGAVALEDEALADYVLNGGNWVDSKAGNYANPSSIRSVVDYAIESGTGQENEGRIYEEKILRDPPIGYSLFHLWPMALVATIAEKHFNDDVWSFKGTDGGGMREAYERYSAYILGELASPRPEQEGNLTDYRWLYELAYARWQTERFESVLSVGTRNKHIVQSIGSVNLLISREIASTDPSNQDLTTGLAGYWNFNETSGNVANDTSTNGQDGIVEGATWTSGRLSNALSFDSTAGDRVDLGSFNVAGNMLTLAAWVNPSAVSTDSRIIAKATGTNLEDVFWMLELDDDIDGEPPLQHRLGFRVNSGGTYFRLTGGVVQTGQWTHIVGVYDGTVMRLYQDGILVASEAKNGALREGTADVWIGDNPPGGQRSFDGLIDEVRIYDRALNVEEIALLRDATIPSAPTDLQIILKP